MWDVLLIIFIIVSNIFEYLVYFMIEDYFEGVIGGWLDYVLFVCVGFFIVYIEVINFVIDGEFG